MRVCLCVVCVCVCELNGCKILIVVFLVFSLKRTAECSRMKEMQRVTEMKGVLKCTFKFSMLQ